MLAAVLGGEVDRIPATPIICSASRQVSEISYAQWATDPDLATQSLLQAQELIGFDAFITLFDLSVEAADFGQKIIYPPENTPYPDYSNIFFNDIKDYHKLESFSWKRARRMKNIIKIIENLVALKGNEIPTVGFLWGPLGVVGMLRRPNNLLTDMVRSPQEVHRALKIVTEVLCEYAVAQCRAGAILVCLDTLYASQSMISKNMWEEFEGPYIIKVADAVRKEGSIVLLHNCGDRPYFDVQIKWINPVAINFADLPDDCADDRELKQKYGNKIILIGNIDTSILNLGTPEEVKAACESKVKSLGGGGRFVLSPGCEFPPNGPLSNAQAMMDVAKNFARK
ncbi:MAG: uroporphyrinogen decarboxylase family protein [Deltaproteobacteria bacterium]|nr:MAG: uroporphyrinogen decarboxylase family protein [Deltaproteobacteria bacterium]